MANIFDYLKWRGDLPFSASPLNEVDLLILTEISYVGFDDFDICQNDNVTTLGELGTKYFEKNDIDTTTLGSIIPKEILKLFYDTYLTERFKDVKVYNYVDKICIEDKEQFSAITYKVGRDTIVAFRGTDDTIVGWEENCNMAVKCPVPAQDDAAKYLDNNVKHARRLYVSGHSKGGNLAIYAGANCSKNIKKHIVGIYDFDGPGFLLDFISDTPYLEIKEKINTYVPEESIVGMFFEHNNTSSVVKSTNKGLMQHDALSWQVIGTNFEKIDSVSDSSKAFKRSFSNWIAAMDNEERSELIRIIFELLTTNQNETITDLLSNKVKLLEALGKVPQKDKSTLYKKVLKFMAESFNESVIEDFVKPKVEAVKKDIEKMKENILLKQTKTAKQSGANKKNKSTKSNDEEK